MRKRDFHKLEPGQLVEVVKKECNSDFEIGEVVVFVEFNGFGKEGYCNAKFKRISGPVYKPHLHYSEIKLHK